VVTVRTVLPVVVFVTEDELDERATEDAEADASAATCSETTTASPFIVFFCVCGVDPRPFPLKLDGCSTATLVLKTSLTLAPPSAVAARFFVGSFVFFVDLNIVIFFQQRISVTVRDKQKKKQRKAKKEIFNKQFLSREFEKNDSDAQLRSHFENTRKKNSITIERMGTVLFDY